MQTNKKGSWGELKKAPFYRNQSVFEHLQQDTGQCENIEHRITKTRDSNWTGKNSSETWSPSWAKEMFLLTGHL